MKTLLFLLASLTAIASPSQVFAYCQSRVGSSSTQSGCATEGALIEWKDACVSFSVDTNPPPGMNANQFANVVSASFDTWNNADCSGRTPGIQLSATSERSNCRKAEFRDCLGNVNTIAVAEEWDSDTFGNDVFAVTFTTQSRSTGQLIDVDIIINPKAGTYGECPDTGCLPRGKNTTIDLANVMTHEIGHFIGIDHSTEAGSTMWAVAPKGEVEKRTLKADDIVAICSIYPANNLGCDPTPRGGLDPNCNDDGGQEFCDKNPGGCNCAVTHTKTRTQSKRELFGYTLPFLLGLGVFWHRRRTTRC